MFPAVPAWVVRPASHNCGISVLATSYRPRESQKVTAGCNLHALWLVNQHTGKTTIASRSAYFKKALHDFLPPETLTKTKHGFSLPFGWWLQSHKALNELARDNLHDLASRHIVRSEFMADLIDNRLPTHPPFYGTMVWVLMMLEQWFKHHVD